MTIDERLEKLAERHEALKQTVELWIAENRERDRTRGTVTAENDGRDRMQGVMEGITRLLHVAENRMKSLENQ